MHLITIQLGEYRVSTDADVVLATDSLGSCIAVTIYDPIAQLGGLLHSQLSEICGDPGVSKLLDEAYRWGGKKERLLVTITSGGQTESPNGSKKNYLAVRKSLWKLGVMLQSEKTGGSAADSVRLEIATGRCWLSDLDKVGHEVVLT
jgi:chemotaxis protein CheD